VRSNPNLNSKSFFKLFYSVKQGNNIYININKRPSPLQFQKKVIFKNDPKTTDTISLRENFTVTKSSNTGLGKKTTLHFYRYDKHHIFHWKKERFFCFAFLHSVLRKLESATHRARLPIKKKKNKTQHTRYKLGCLYGAAERWK
jgi:hypothetical protein